MLAQEAIWLAGASGTLVEGNVTSGAYAGTYGIIVRGSDHNVIRRNTVEKPFLTFDGFPDGGGMILCESSHNTVEDNSIPVGFVGINLGVDQDCGETGLTANTANVIRGNRISDINGDRRELERTGDGILIGPLAKETLVEANRVTRSSADGIDVQSASTTLTKNSLTSNADWGIAAPFGAIDGGGNRARDNGQSAQCQVVVCR